MDAHQGITMLHWDRHTGQILGVGLCGVDACELIETAVLAIEMGATIEDLAATVDEQGQQLRLLDGQHAALVAAAPPAVADGGAADGGGARTPSMVVGTPGVVGAGPPPSPAGSKPTVAMTMFGVTTPCCDAVRAALEEEYEVLTFHATGAGGRVRSGAAKPAGPRISCWRCIPSPTSSQAQTRPRLSCRSASPMMVR